MSSYRVLGLRVEGDPLEFLDEIQTLRGVQAVDARYVAGRGHLEEAAERALTAGERGKRIADEIEVEVLLYAAGTRQISRAIEIIGIDEETGEVGVIDLLGEFDLSELGVTVDREDSLLEFREEKVGDIMEAFDVSETELETVGAEKLPLLVRERVVLSDLER